MASVKTKSGELVHRVVFEFGPRGEVLLLRGQSSGGSHLSRDFDLLTVSGRNPSLVRGWSSTSFNLEFEWSLNLVNPTAAGDVLWFYDKHFLYHVIPVWSSHIELVTYIANSGETTKSTATKIAASWIRQESCRLAGSNFVCLLKNQLITLDLLAESSNIRTVAVEATESDVIEVIPDVDAVRVRNEVVLLKEALVVRLKSNADSVVIEPELGDNGALIEVAVEGNVSFFFSLDLNPKLK